MNDDFDLDYDQSNISETVRDKFLSNCNTFMNSEITPDKICDAILSLKRGKSTGLDKISAEHLQYGLNLVCPHHCVTF
jgi:hypothetical protein